MRLIVGLAILILAVIFAAQNAQPVSIAFLAWQVNGSLAVVVILCFACGALTAAILILPGMVRHRLTLRRQRGKLDTLEIANKELRNALTRTETRSSDDSEPPGPGVDR